MKFTEKQKAIAMKAFHDEWKAHISKGNKKIGNIANFNLMPICTCSLEARETCAKGGCYAIPENRYPACLYNRLQNTYMARYQLPKLEAQLIEFFTSYKGKYFRLHEAGDFVSIGYCIMWARIAKQFPPIRFYTYSKAFRILRECADEISGINNFTILLSAWKGLAIPCDLVSKGFAVAYTSECENIPACAVSCPNQINNSITCEKCGLCSKRVCILFKKHK